MDVAAAEISTMSPSADVSAANYVSVGLSFPTIPTSDDAKSKILESIVAGQEDRPQETVPTNEMAIEFGRIDETAKDFGPENGTNGEAMETQDTVQTNGMAIASDRIDETAKDSGPENGSNCEAIETQETVPTNEMAIASGRIDETASDSGPENGTNWEAIEKHPSESDVRQTRRVEGSNPITNMVDSDGTSAQFCSDDHPDPAKADRRNRNRGGSKRQASTSQIDDSKRIYSLGRLLSSVLRHRAVDLGLKMQSDGYVLVKDLLNLRTKTRAGLPLSSHTFDDIQEAVKRDNKQRFGLREENGQQLIRANQGHTIQTVKSEDLCHSILFAEEVPVCVHGTYLKYLNSIEEQGLKRMKRLHVHFATGLFKEKGVISGMRSSCEVLIYLNVEKYLKDGMKLYRSENGVILAEGNNGVIPSDYFAKIEQVKH